MGNDMKLDNVIDNRNMNLGELWENIAELSDHVRYDNLKICNDLYPISIRKMQLDSIKSLIKEIEKHHCSE